MKLAVAVFSLLLSCAAAADPAKVTVLDGDDLARSIVASSLREDVAAADPRVSAARPWLAKAAKTYGVDEKAVAAHCERAARWFFDVTRSRATPLEMLEALALTAKPGMALEDAMRGYVEARRATAGKTHAEALAKLGLPAR